ncbi:hypothetical protein KI387_006576, partial [Taxus chinensis]
APIIVREEDFSEVGCGIVEVTAVLGIGKTIGQLVDMVGGREKGGTGVPPSSVARGEKNDANCSTKA